MSSRSIVQRLRQDRLDDLSGVADLVVHGQDDRQLLARRALVARPRVPPEDRDTVARSHRDGDVAQRRSGEQPRQRGLRRQPLADVLRRVRDRQRVLGLEQQTEAPHERGQVAGPEERRLVLEEGRPVAPHHPRRQRVCVRVRHHEQRGRRRRLRQTLDDRARVTARLEQLVEQQDLGRAREQRVGPADVRPRGEALELGVVDLRDLEPDALRGRKIAEVVQEPADEQRPLEGLARDAQMVCGEALEEAVEIREHQRPIARVGERAGPLDVEVVHRALSCGVHVDHAARCASHEPHAGAVEQVVRVVGLARRARHEPLVGSRRADRRRRLERERPPRGRRARGGRGRRCRPASIAAPHVSHHARRSV